MDGTIRSWNDGARALYGWTAEEAIGRVSHELLTTTFPESLATIEAAVEAADAWEGQLRHVTRDGRRVVVESRWVAVRDEDGQVGAVMEINRDVTRMVAAVEALEWSEAELAEAERLALTGSWRLDTRTGVPTWSAGMYRIFGLHPDAGVPPRDRLVEFVGPDVAARLGALVTQLVATGEPYTTDLEVRRPDGSTIHVEAHGEVVRDASGTVIAIRGAVVDITELHRAREAAELALRDLAEAQRLAHVGSWRWDAETGDVDWSAEMFRIAGLDPSQGVPSLEERERMFTPETHPALDAAARALMAGEDHEAALDLRRPSGEVRHVAVRGEAITRSDGSLAWMRGTLADVTERREAELLLQRFNEELESRVLDRTARLEAANEELRTFSHAISHDLRGPVRAIASFAGLVLRSAGDHLDATDRHRLDNIVQSGITMGRLIDDLAAYTRLGQAAVQAIPVPLGPLVNSLRVLLSARLAETGGEIHLTGEDAVPLADPSLLERLLLNLVDNGLAYARAGVPPVVRIGAEARGSQVIVSVADNGIGIADELRERVFELFARTRADQQLERSGVGLAVARKAARTMGTDLELDSEVGAGSTFSLVLPRA